MTAVPPQSVPELMAWAHQSSETGVLTTGEDLVVRELLFVDGEVRAARSSSEMEKLGSWLVDREQITDEEKALTLLAQEGESAPPLGHLLVRRSLIDESDLERELQQLTVTIVTRAARAGGAAEFHSGAFREQPDTLPGITTPQLILIAARSVEAPEPKAAAIGTFDQLAWMRGGLETIVQELELTPTEAFVLSRLHGHTRLDQLQRLCSLPEEQFLAAMYALRTAGLIQIGQRSDLTPAVAPEPAPRPREPSAQPTDGMTGPERRERDRVVELASKVRQFNHYQALGLSPAAGASTIASAWDSYRRRFDPDRAVTEEHLRGLEQELRAVHERAEEAYYVLHKAASRERYDQILRSLSTSEEEEEQIQRTSQMKARKELIAANLQRAEQLERSGEIYAAIQMLSQVCELDPQPETLLRLARLYLRNPLWAKKALEALKKVLELDAEYIDAWVELAEFWRRRGNRERQRKALERALATHPDHERAAEMYRQLVGRRELERLLKRARRR